MIAAIEAICCRGIKTSGLHAATWHARRRRHQGLQLRVKVMQLCVATGLHGAGWA